jgi:hypothetical protein
MAACSTGVTFTCLVCVVAVFKIGSFLLFGPFLSRSIDDGADSSSLLHVVVVVVVVVAG